MAEKTSDVLLTRDEAKAALGGISTNTIIRMEKRGVLPAVRFAGGRRVFYRKADVEKLIRGE